MSDHDALTDDALAWSPLTRAIIDLHPAHDVSPIDVVVQMRDIVEQDTTNVLSLGPPIRLQVSEEDLLAIMDRIAYRHLVVRRWPFWLAPNG